MLQLDLNGTPSKEFFKDFDCRDIRETKKLERAMYTEFCILLNDGFFLRFVKLLHHISFFVKIDKNRFLVCKLHISVHGIINHHHMAENIQNLS